jgi:hypothetical protein
MAITLAWRSPDLAVHHLDVFACSNSLGFVRELLVVYPIPI